MKIIKNSIGFALIGALLLVSTSCQKEHFDSSEDVAATVEESTDLKMGFTAEKKTLKATKFDPEPSLLPRFNHKSLVFDGKMWILGGTVKPLNKGSNYTSNDVVFSTDGDHWKTVTQKSNFPKRTLFGATVFQNKMWIAGGFGKPGKVENDVWSSEDGIEWKLVTPNAQFPARGDHTLTAFNGSLWLIGGLGFNTKTNTSENLSDIWRSFDGMNWVKVLDEAPFGSRREFDTVVHDGKLWIVRGADNGVKQGVWYTENGYYWVEATDQLPFSARAFHTLESDGNLMWMIAGYVSSFLEGDTGRQNDIWYSSNGEDWFEAEPSQEFPKRAQHSSVFFQGKLWVINGSELTDVWSFEDPSYTKTKSIGIGLTQ